MADGLTQWEVTIAESLSAAGYATALYGKWHLGSDPGRHPNDQGFDEWYGIPRTTDEALWPGTPGYSPSVMPPELILEGRKGEKSRALKVYDLTERRLIDAEITRRTVDFMERQSRAGKPFYIYASITQPHIPTLPNPAFVGKTGNGEREVAELPDHVRVPLGARPRQECSRGLCVLPAPAHVLPVRGGQSAPTALHRPHRHAVPVAGPVRREVLRIAARGLHLRARAPAGPHILGLLASLGIERGKPYNPDEKTRRAMRQAAIDAWYYLQDRLDKLPRSYYFWPDRQYVPLLLPDKNGGFTYEYGLPVESGRCPRSVSTGRPNLSTSRRSRWPISSAWIDAWPRSGGSRRFRHAGAPAHMPPPVQPGADERAANQVLVTQQQQP